MFINENKSNIIVIDKSSIILAKNKSKIMHIIPN